MRYSVEVLADDAATVLDGHGVTGAHLVGMSPGGFLARLVALEHPERAIAPTLISSECLADTDLDLPQMSPETPACHAAAASLDWSDRDAGDSRTGRSGGTPPAEADSLREIRSSFGRL